MKQQVVCLAVWLPWFLVASAQTSLPEVAPGPFGPVPSPITAGPALPAAPMESAAPAVNDCSNAGALLKSLGIKLTADQVKLLDAQRFLLLPIEATALAEELPTSEDETADAFTSDEMLNAFSMLGGADDAMSRTPANTRLITPDLALHAWHRGFSRALETIERRRLHTLLTTFLAATLKNARELRSASSGAVAERLAWTEARFAAPWVLLGAPDPKSAAPQLDDNGKPIKKAAAAPYADVVKERLAQACKGLPNNAAAALKQEIALVLAAEGMTKSPLFGEYAPDKPADYSQFKPRSHYTKSPALGGYFRAMMFLGRNGYQLNTPGSTR